jgi:hypothetical protein
MIRGLPAEASDLAVDDISDRRFAAQLEALKKLKEFLFYEKVPLQADTIEAIDLGSLNNIKYALNGRQPTESEWKALDQKLAGLTSILTPPLRWKLRIRELRFFFVTVPIVSMGASVIATFLLTLLMTVGEARGTLWFLVSYVLMLLIWTISQGTLGACAFLCIGATVHALKERISSNSLYPTIDVTNENILIIRVILGALFSLLTIPISGRSILIVDHAFSEDHAIPPIQDWITVLVPFMFGFSTTLVLAIFNKVVGGVSAIFGISTETTTRSE